MRTLQIYESTILDPESDLAVHVVTIPARSVPRNLSSSPERVAEELQLGRLEPVPAGTLLHAILTVLALGDGKMSADQFWLGRREDLENLDPRYYALAEHLAVARVIPFENSPLSAESIGNLASGTTTSMSVVLAYVVVGPTPLLLLAVPAGIVICGAARGIARGLEEGLRDRIAGWIRGEKKGSPAAR